jgi:UDP:flavonoid glycosyltransferase YjiC (YdhE family)
VLPHVAAVVTHGGFGTLAAAIAAGRPLVLVPISADQPMNAGRCADAGLGVVVGPGERTPDAIRRAVRVVLADRRYTAAAAAAGDAARAQPELGHALDLLERLAGRGLPITVGAAAGAT